MTTTTLPDVSHDALIEAVQSRAHPLRGARDDYDPLFELIGDARFVLIGAASYGTHEFDRERARLTKRLIQEKGFTAVAVEADWPDADRINRYVRGVGGDADAARALEGFKHFPTWRWRNADVLDFVGWLREYNDAAPPGSPKVGFYGLDLFSTSASMAAFVSYLEGIDPAAAERARKRCTSFDLCGEYARSCGGGEAIPLNRSVEKAAIAHLVDRRRIEGESMLRAVGSAADDQFYADFNDPLLQNAGYYYRTMCRGGSCSWSLRDCHMSETLDALVAFLHRDGPAPKVVVWAHNLHLGDSRATEIGLRGQSSLGQFVRQRHGRDAVLVGLTTYEGTVTAASHWDGPAERKQLRPAFSPSYEALFHEASREPFLLCLRGDRVASLGELRLERAIGAIYRPETDSTSHYLYASLPVQFDAVVHLDRTRAALPLEPIANAPGAEVPPKLIGGLSHDRPGVGEPAIGTGPVIDSTA
jgi:erythromycin esterase-like protein